MRFRTVLLTTTVALATVACARAATPADQTTTTAVSVSTAPASSSPKAGKSGATLDIETQAGSASYTVSNWRLVPSEFQIIPAKGAMYAVDVRVVGNTGAVPINGFYFAARTADGSSIAPAVGAVRPGITTGLLTPGDSVEGHVAFDLAPGTAITGVLLRDPSGQQRAFWSVN